MKNIRVSPNKIQMSMNLMLAVLGNFEDIELFNVYMTNIEVMAMGTLVLKCSLRKYRVA